MNVSYGPPNSITENLYNIFIEKSNAVCTSIDCDFIAPRVWIIGVLIYIIAAVLHLRHKITFFCDKSDALLTILSPLLAILPVGIFGIVLYFFGADKYVIERLLIDTYSLTLIYFLGCSFRSARRGNPNSIFGFVISCFGRAFSIVSIIALFIGIFGIFTPNTERARSQFEIDYMWAKSLAIIGACYAGLIWLVLKLSRKDEWGDYKKWLSLR